MAEEVTVCPPGRARGIDDNSFECALSDETLVNIATDYGDVLLDAERRAMIDQYPIPFYRTKPKNPKRKDAKKP